MTKTIKRKPHIAGGFSILVIPSVDLVRPELTIPPIFQSSRNDSNIRAVAASDMTSSIGSSWAFNNKDRKKVVKNMRSLADWIEKNAIAD